MAETWAKNKIFLAMVSSFYSKAVCCSAIFMSSFSRVLPRRVFDPTEQTKALP